MGLSSLPTPSDGVLTLVLVNTALSFSLFKQIIRSILHSIGFDPYYLFGSDLDDISEPSSTDVTDSISHQFKTQVKAVRFGHRANSGPEQVHHLDCRVCLSRFEPDSFVYHLPCGHFFHVLCLAKWLDYHHATCPLCRTKVFPNSFHDDVDVSCPQVY